MNETQQMRLLEDTAVPNGTVSAKCRLVEAEGLNIVLVKGVEMFLYAPDDKLGQRMAWVQICENGYALHSQVADTLGIGLRTLQYWIKRYREEGMVGLVDRAKSGAPRKVTGAIEKRILRLRSERATVREIAAKCGFSIGTVHKILSEQHEQSAHEQMELTEVEQASIEECEVVEEPPTEDESPELAAAETLPVVGSPEDVEVSPIKEVVPAEEAQSQGQMATGGLSEEVESSTAKDRGFDRILARLGMLDDASALFASEENVPWAGVMMAAVILSDSPFLGLAKKVYGSIGPAFYGLRTVMLTYVTMALLRIRRIEDVRKADPRKLGRVLGLDRVAEVKTLRRKWHRLCKAGKALELMEAVGRSRVEQLDQPPEVIMVDGHLGIYTGKKKIGSVFSTCANQVVKGRTDNWIHLPGGSPLLALSCPFNEGLCQGLQEAIDKSRALIGADSLTCVFDRGGWSTELWENIIEGGNHVMSYRKGSFDPWEPEAFEAGPITINGKDHAFAPCMRDVEIPVYEKEIAGKGCKINYCKTSRMLKLKEVRLLRADQGQTSILTSRADLTAEQVVSLQLARWGDQENQFKYMIREFDLDALWMYGTDPIDANVDHPHPDYVRLQSQLRKLVDQRKKFLNRIWSSLPDATQTENDEQKHERIALWLHSTDPKKLNKLNAIETSIARVQETLEQTPQRESVSAAGFEQLKPESRRLSNVIKTVACDTEGALAEMIAPHYKNAENEKRRLIAAALTTAGSLRLEPGALVVRLDPQSSPVRTRAIDAVCRQLNDYQARFPGSNRIIRFETDRETEGRN